MINHTEMIHLENVLEYMIQMENLNEDDSEEYLQELFDIESQIDELMEYRQYQKLNMIECNVDYLDLIKHHSSGESLKDVITFNKSRIIIMIKQFIADLIQMIMEFFQIGFVQKKILLKIHKQIKQYRLDLIKRFTERLETKGYYDFSDKPIEVYDPVRTLFRPIEAMISVGVVLNLNLKPTINYVQRNYSNNGLAGPNGMFREGFLHSNPKIKKDMEKVFDAMKDLMVVAAKAEFTNVSLSHPSILSIANEASEELKRSIPELGLNDIFFNERISIDRIKQLRKQYPEVDFPIDFKKMTSLTSAPQDLNVSEFFSKIAATIGCKDYTDYDKGYDSGYIFRKLLSSPGSSPNKGSFLFELFDTNNGLRDKIKEESDQCLEMAEDIRDGLKDIDETDIDSTNAFEIYLFNLQASEQLANSCKNLNFKKSLDEMKKIIDKAQKTIYAVDPDFLANLEEKYSITGAITAISYQYNISKTILNKFIKVAANMIDTGITDIKKVESIII